MSGVKRDCAHPRAGHQHGTRAAYEFDGCRCFPCRIAAQRYREALAAGEPIPTTCYPDATGVRRRVEALHAIGWSANQLAQRLRYTRRAVLRYREATNVLQTTHARVAALYDELWDAEPVGAVGATKAWAARMGFLPPLAWDDESIDDPDAQPHADEPETAVLDDVLVDRYIDGTAPDCGWRKPPERLEAIRRLAAKGLNDSEIGRRIRLSRHAVTKERERHGIPAGTPREAA